MDLKLQGRRALVAGASSGLGAATAHALAAEGVELVICARREEKLFHEAETITQTTGIQPVCVVADLATAEGLHAVEHAVADHPTDILVSNAGGPPPGLFLEHEPERFDDAHRLVLEMAIGLTRIVLDQMVKRGWGRLIYITSIGARQPVDDLILSNTYRAGVTGFCKTISNTYARHGITANCVCPGYTATERLSSLAATRAVQQGISAEQVLAGFSAAIPAGRVGQPGELASLVTFLASEQAAYITGNSIPVDGGACRSLI
jgi:3-oxoacyl-[acyl-carrier protein] reductase